MVEATGQVLSQAQLTARVGWVLDMIDAELELLLFDRYTQDGLALIAGGVAADGVKFPSNAWMMMRRLHWTADPDDAVCDRVRRCIEEAAGRTLRSAVDRHELIAGLLATWPKDPDKRTPTEWAAMWKAVPDKTDKTTLRNRTRQIAAYLAEHGQLPGGLIDLEPEAHHGRAWLLASADRQLVSLTRPTPDRAQLRVKLPTIDHPTSVRTGWEWVLITVTLPPTVPEVATLCTPTLRIVGGQVRVDLPFVITTPTAPLTGHQRALGVDWGINTLLTTSFGWLDQDQVKTDGRPYHFDAAGAATKSDRLRRQREVLQIKIKRHAALLTGLAVTDPRAVKLAAKTVTLQDEIDRISERQSNLHHQLAWAAARWLVDLAVATGATAIFFEDLRTLEPRHPNASMNARIANSVRGEIVTATRHLATKAGIALSTVPAGGTSSQCPRCLKELHHQRSASDPTPGFRWAVCGHCGHQGDRDHLASERVVSRGLAAQAHIQVNRTGVRRCAKTIDIKVRRQHKTAPTPKQNAHRARSTRTIPAIKRPAGDPETNSTELDGEQYTVLPELSRRQRRRRRTVGRGFHTGVHTLWTPQIPRTRRTPAINNA